MKRIVPRLTGSDHGVEDRQELTHAGDDGKLFRFAGSDQAVVELLDDGISSDGRERCHVESATHLPASAEDGALTTRLAGIAIEGRHADERAHLPARQLAQLGHFGDQSGDGGWADTAHAGEPLGQVGMMGFDVLGKLRSCEFFVSPPPPGHQGTGRRCRAEGNNSAVA